MEWQLVLIESSGVGMVGDDSSSQIGDIGRIALVEVIRRCDLPDIERRRPILGSNNRHRSVQSLVGEDIRHPVGCRLASLIQRHVDI